MGSLHHFASKNHPIYQVGRIRIRQKVERRNFFRDNHICTFTDTDRAMTITNAHSISPIDGGCIDCLFGG